MISVVSFILCFVIFGVWWWWLAPRGMEPPMYPGKRPFVGHAYLFMGNLKSKIYLVDLRVLSLTHLCKEASNFYEIAMGLTSEVLYQNKKIRNRCTIAGDIA